MLADATFTTVAAVAAVLASLGIGGVVGALATGWLAQKDKFRERTIAACDEFLEKESHARELLFKAERALLLDRVETLPMAAGDAQRLLAEATAACRVLQTQAYRLSLFLGSGRQAQPAERDAQRIGARYYSWRKSLYDFAIGEALAPEPGENEHFEAAKEAYSTFAKNANAAIRPRIIGGVRLPRRTA